MCNLQKVNMNYHAEAGASSLKVINSFMICRAFCFGRPFFVICLDCMSIWTSMRELDSVAQEMSEFWSVLWFGGHFVFSGNLVFGGHFVFIICLHCLYEILTLYLKKWVSYAQFSKRCCAIPSRAVPSLTARPCDQPTCIISPHIPVNGLGKLSVKAGCWI